MLVDIDRTRLPPGRTPLAHSPPAAALWGLFGCGTILSLAPGLLAGTLLALSLGFGTHLALDAFAEGGIFLWPRSRRPSDWLMPYGPESLVQLEDQLFVVPSEDGAIARPWSGWRTLELLPRGRPGEKRCRAFERASPHAGLALSVASLAALLLAVVLA